MEVDARMLLLITSLSLCGSSFTAASELHAEPTTRPMGENSTLLNETSTFLPTNSEASTTLPANTEASTSLPTTEFSTMMSTNTEASTSMPTTEFSTMMSTNTEASTSMPTTEFSTMMSTNTEASTLMSTSEFSTMSTNTEVSTSMPTSEFSTMSTNTEASTSMQTSEFSTVLSTNTEASTMLPTNSEASATLPTTNEPSTMMPTNSEPTNLWYSEESTIPSFELDADLEQKSANRANISLNASPPAPAVATLTRLEAEEDYRRTVIFIKKTTNWGEAVFIRGGASRKPIPIKHRPLDIRESHYQRDNWAIGDNFLDWDDQPEANQTAIGDGGEAKGSPAQWTTNYKDGPFFHPLNLYGDHYWMVDVMMDCLKTENGFFEFKGIMQDKTWESGDDLAMQCEGMRPLPRTDINHFAMCGKVNLFFWGTGRDCKVIDFPTPL